MRYLYSRVQQIIPASMKFSKTPFEIEIPNYNYYDVDRNEYVAKIRCKFYIFNPHTSAQQFATMNDLKDQFPFLLLSAARSIFGETPKLQSAADMESLASKLSQRVNTLVEAWGVRLCNQISIYYVKPDDSASLPIKNKEYFENCEMRVLQDKIDGLEYELDSTLDVLWRRGDVESRIWIGLNYPAFFEARGNDEQKQQLADERKSMGLPERNLEND